MATSRAKNIVVAVLSIIIIVLVDVVMTPNYRWFSDEWFIGIGMIIVSIVGGGLFIYIKLKGMGYSFSKRIIWYGTSK